MSSDRRSPSAGSGHSHRSRSERASGSMGHDGGEVGRRMAAEDEYIRRELTETTAFCNAFWGNGDAGFETISARNKSSQRALEDLKFLYKERADIEAEYAKRLAKLSKQALGQGETGALKAAFDTVRIELDATSRTHNDLANMIKKDLEGQVTEFTNRQMASHKVALANIEKLHKHKQTQEQYVHKSRDKYEQDCIKINGYTAQSSLVQGKDLDKVASKLDKAQATVNQNDRDYQNFVRALRDTTVKWNAEWKTYLDHFQDQEEERIDFSKSNLWNFANAVSAVCVADDESCERIRVSLENVETPRDVQFFIQTYGTGSLIPAPPEYINYAKGQAPPARPVYHTAKFQRNTMRPTQLPVPQQPAGPIAQQPASPPAQQPLPQQQPPQPQPPAKDVTPDPAQAPRQAPQQAYASAAPDGYHSNQQSPSKPPPTASVPDMAVAPVSQPQTQPPRAAPPTSAQNGVAPAPTVEDDEDPIAKALASLRMRPGGKSPGVSSPPQQNVPFAQPGQIVQNMPPQRAHSPSPSVAYTAQNVPPRARSPSAAFMQAPARAASPMPVEDVVGQYGQSFPGERKSLSRQNSVASHAGVQSPQQQGRPKSPVKQEQGFAGVGARGRSPSPQPWSKPTQQQQQQYQAAPAGPPAAQDQPRTGTLSRRQSQAPVRSSTPLGIALDATGSVTHDQMAVDYMRRTGSVPPQAQPPQPQQGIPPPVAVAQSQAQPGRPPSVVHGNYPGPGHHKQASVASHYSQAPSQQPTGLQSPYTYQGSVSKAGHQSYQSQHAAQPSVYSTTGQVVPQAPAQYGGYAGPAYAQSPQPAQQVPPPQQQGVPPHLQHQQFAASPGPAQPAYQQQQPPPAGGYYGHPGAPVMHPQQQPPQQPQHQDTPASAYMQEYLQQQQGGAANGGRPPSVMGGQQPAHLQQQQWGRATSPAPAQPAAAPAPPAQQQHAPTGQYSDAGQPILFYVKALYDYQASNPDEFSFTTGDIIAVTHTEADGWWQGELLDEARRSPGANTFPSNFVALLM